MEEYKTTLLTISEKNSSGMIAWKSNLILFEAVNGGRVKLV